MKNYFIFFISVLVIGTTLFFSGCTLDSNINNNIFGTNEPSMTPRLIEGDEYASSMEVVNNAASAVVGIVNISGNTSSVGSGVAIAKNGYLLTNSHVIINPNNITLYLADGSSTTGQLVWDDATLDLAIVKSQKDLPYLKIAEDNDVNVGEDVLAIGTPFELQFQHTVTKGIVSALNRTVQVDTDGGSSYLQSLIQHDASINPGNSGGPLINSSAELIGINTLKIEAGEGMGFAIPAVTTRNVVEKVITDGSYTSAYLGVFGYDAHIANFKDVSKNQNGYYLLGVQKDSPAYKAGLREKDIILSLDKNKTNTMLDFRRHFYGYKPNQSVTVTYLSDGHKKTVELVLSKKPNIKAEKLNEDKSEEVVAEEL